METGVIIALIASFSAIFTSLMTFFINQYRINKPKKDDVVKEQLEKVISPIQKILVINQELPNENRAIIEQIINDNFILVPTKAYEAFQKKDDEGFAKEIEKCFAMARNKLGYNQIRQRIDAHRFYGIALIINGAVFIISVISIIALFLFVKDGKGFKDIAFKNSLEGVNYYAMGDYETALDKYKIALAINKEMYGEASRETGGSYRLLGDIYKDIGKKDLAIYNMQKAYEIYYKSFGESDPRTLSLMVDIIELSSNKTEE